MMTQMSIDSQKALMVFDVDGTIQTAGGPIALDWLTGLKQDWGILSSRSVERSREAIPGLEPLFIRVCRVDQRREELIDIKRELPGYGRYIYIADREIDATETLAAGWEFCFADGFNSLIDCSYGTILLSQTDVIRKIGAEVEGQMPESQLEVLYHLAKQEGPGVILEIGVLQGRSLLTMAAGSPGTEVYGIDPWSGAAQACFERFQENLRRFGMIDQVKWERKTSMEAVEGWDKPIKLLHIDGAHEYENVKADLEKWSPFVIKGGFIAMDDVGKVNAGLIRGPRQVFEEAQANPCFEGFGVVIELGWFRKIC